MKKYKLFIAFLFLILALAITPVLAFDPPPPPPNGGNGDTPPPGGGAPIEGGMLIFVVLAAGYFVSKCGKEKKDLNPEYSCQ